MQQRAPSQLILKSCLNCARRAGVGATVYITKSSARPSELLMALEVPPLSSQPY
jgi:hypothetical protein